MSLLNELTATVVQAEYLSVDQIFSSQYSQYQNLKGYHVITGYAEPRNETELLILHNVTNEPLLVPSNSFPIKAFFIPTIPLVSPDLNTSELKFTLFDDTSFSNSYQFYGGQAMTGAEVNSKAFVEMIDVASSITPVFDGYPYIGLTSTGDFTAGLIQVYVYYLPCSQPPL